MYIYTLIINNKTQKAISLLSTEEIFNKGLPPESIIGTIAESNSNHESINSEKFIPNLKFIDFFHQIIAKFAPHSSNFIIQAKQQQNGWIYIIDARCIDQETVLPEDIIGAFELNRGEIMSESYQKNENHLILSKNGFFKLEPTLHKHLMEETRKLLDAHG